MIIIFSVWTSDLWRHFNICFAGIILILGLDMNSDLSKKKIKSKWNKQQKTDWNTVHGSIDFPSSFLTVVLKNCAPHWRPSPSLFHRSVRDWFLLPRRPKGQSQNQSSDLSCPHGWRYRPLRWRLHSDGQKARRHLINPIWQIAWRSLKCLFSQIKFCYTWDPSGLQLN